MKRYLTRAAQGAVLGCLAPLGWMLLLALGGHSPAEDLARNGGVYLYMLLGAMAGFAGFGAYVAHRELELDDSMLTDELTGAFNLRFLRRRLRSDAAAAERLDFPLSLLVVEVDGLRRLIENHGRLAGDLVLRAVGRQLIEGQRRGDTIARSGGGAFALVLPFASGADAARIGERLRAAIAALPVRLPSGQNVSVTVSVGVTAHRPGREERAQTLLQRADNARAIASRQGGDRVAVLDEPVASEARPVRASARPA